MRKVRVTGLAGPIPTLEFQVDSVIPDCDVAWFKSVVVDYGKTAILKSGQTYRVGFVDLKIQYDDASNVLYLEEPNFQGTPATYQREITKTLLILRIQKDTVESYGLIEKLDIPNWRQSAIICTNTLTSTNFILDRGKPDEHASGWFCGALKCEHSHNEKSSLKLISLYELCLHCPQIFPFLAFPSGTLIRFKDEKPVVFCDDRQLQPSKESYAQRKYFPTPADK